MRPPKKDLQWLIACAHAINGTVSLYNCLQPWLDIFVDASLKGVGGALHPFVYPALSAHPTWVEYCPLGGHQYFYLFTGLCISLAVVSVLGVILRWHGHLALWVWHGSHTSCHCPQYLASSSSPGL
jgi:hypothetical protein